MGLNYSMMKVKKTELDKITYIDNNTPMNIQGVNLAGDVRIGKDDSFILVSQVPSMKVANGRCTEFPSECCVKNLYLKLCNFIGSYSIMVTKFKIQYHHIALLLQIVLLPKPLSYVGKYTVNS